MSIPVSATYKDEHFVRNHHSRLKELTKITHFTQQEADALGIIYYKFLDEFGVKREQMDRNQLRAFFHSRFGISDDYMIDRSFLYLDKGLTPFITLETWIKTLSLFLRGTLEEKMKYSFYVYDLSGGGRIKRNDIIKLLRKCFIYDKEEDIELMVKDFADILMKKIDIDGDGEISYEDFSESVKQQRQLLQVFGRCLPDLLCAIDFMTTFTHELPN